MAFNTYCFTLWMFFILFTVVKGSCLEYGHSCWGAHGKRSGNNKIYHAKDKATMALDFQDLNGLNEKNTYDSTEELLNAASETLAKEVDDEDLVEGPDKTSIKLKKFLYKKPNKTSKSQRNMEFSEKHHVSVPAISDRWRRLPLYSLKRAQIMRPENNWLNELDQEQQINVNDYA